MIGPNIPPMKGRALFLDGEQPDQDDDGERHHGGRQSDGASTFKPSSALRTEIAG